MALALFDLDNTLIVGDSDHYWGEFLIEKGLVSETEHREKNDQYYRDYLDSSLDINDYLHFAMGHFHGKSLSEVQPLLDEYVANVIPTIAPNSRELIEAHESAGDTLVIVTATNQILAQGVAKALGVEHLIATDVRIEDGIIVGGLAGEANFRDGKIIKMKQWIEQHGGSLSDAYFYSDSHNDIPLLEAVKWPIAVDPDEQLTHWALLNDHPIISLRG